ncbi:MAG TPA: hypothetical protein VJB90_04385 [Candidatus Nanoarchaeia archaeon]|nr:hypothetical protein [Candidatus Nanoarchaeia archaeon]
MHYQLVSGDIVSKLAAAKDEGHDNIKIDENDVIYCNLAEFYEMLEKLQFKRIKMKANGLLLSEYKNACNLIARGVRIFEIVFHHHDPKKHDEIAGSGSYRTLLESVSTAYQASIDNDVPIIFQFTLAFRQPEELAKAVSILSELYPSHFRIEGEVPRDDLTAAIKAGNETGIWVETTQKFEDALLSKRFAP